MNLSVPLDKVALFISRLLKGFQNLANSDNDFIPYWGDYLYEMEDIGMVVFQPIFDTTSESTAFYVKSIRWNFPTVGFSTCLITENVYLPSMGNFLYTFGSQGEYIYLCENIYI